MRGQRGGPTAGFAPCCEIEPGDHLPVATHSEGQGFAVEYEGAQWPLPVLTGSLGHAASPALCPPAVTSPMALVEAYDGRTTEQRWDWVLSRLKVAGIGKDEARQARRLLSDAKLHGHKYAIDAVLAIIARQQKGQVTIFTSNVDDLEKLVPESIVVKRV